MRRGLPILPVRYAVCQIDENPDVPALPDDRVSELYPLDDHGNPIAIDLETGIDGDGETSVSKEKRNKYILRKLRAGYLYLYDEGNDQWYAYKVSETGELLQFSPGEPPEDTSPDIFACNQPSHREHASLITLNNLASATKAWLAYVESPWSEQFKDQVASDAQWREKHMQCFDVAAWINVGEAKYAFPQGQIEELVPEYLSQSQTESNDEGTANCSAAAADAQLQSHCLPGRLGRTGRELQDLLGAMDERVANNEELTGKKGLGVMLAIKDEVGILEELNDYRQRPRQALQTYQAKDNNEREGKWLVAVNRLKAALETAAQARIREIDEEMADELDQARALMEAQTRKFEAHYESEFAKADTEAARDAVEQRYNFEKSTRWAGTPDGLVGFDELLGCAAKTDEFTNYKILLRQRNREIATVDKDLERVQTELPDYYDESKAAEIEKKLQPYKKRIEDIVPPMDADYAQWLVHGLDDALGRYDCLDSRYGLRVTEVVSDALVGGVMSPNSEWAWNQLMAKLETPDSPILRAYFHNHRDTIHRFVEDAKALGEDKSFFGEVALKHWTDRLKELRAVATKGWGLSDFNAMRQALSRLGATVVAACGALIGQSSADQAARGESISPDTRPMVRYARLLQVDNLVTAPDEGGSSGARYVVEMEMTMGDYQRSVSYQANRAGKPLQNNQGEYQYLETREDGARVGGNLPDLEVSDETRVRVLWQVTEIDLERFAGYVEGVSRDAIAAGGKPVTIPLLDQQSMMFELEKQKSRLEGLDGSTKFIEAICVLVSFFETGSALKDQPDSLETWWKMLGPTLGVLQVTFEVAGDRNMRRGLAAGGQMAYTQAARGTQYLNIGNGLRMAGAVIGIIDGFMALAEAESMARRGELRSRVRTQAFLGGLGIGGGLLALAASSLVLIPFIIGVVMLIGAYLLVKLVPNNIATWLRRSLYGKEQGTFRFQPFQSMQEEQESLKMVFSGIEFDMDVVRAIDSWGGTLMPLNWRDDVKSGGSKKFNLTVTIKFPKGLEGQLKVLMKCYPSEGEERYLGGATYTKNSLVSVDRYGQVIGNSQARDVFEDEPDLSKKSGFDLKQGDDLNTLCYEMDLDMTTGLLESNLIYIGQSGNASQVKYPMELSV
jgi:F0F1-type ATP synthase membrane subunit c/vacuolar-type H+-ATPase subunit K